MSIEDEAAKYEALEQYARARDRHDQEAAELLAARRYADRYIEVGAASILRRRMFEELERGTRRQSRKR